MDSNTKRTLLCLLAIIAVTAWISSSSLSCRGILSSAYFEDRDRIAQYRSEQESAMKEFERK